MRALLLAAALAAPAAAQQALPAAPVWLPDEAFSQWSRVDALMRDRGSLKLTIGLTPAMATPLCKAALAPWLADGRIEVAARIPGDPVLPLMTAHPDAPRPQDALERLAEARAALKTALSTAPAGFVPGAGALDAALLPALSASGASWVLAGPYALPGEPWASAGRAAFVPALAGTDPSAPGASVFADSSPASAFLDAAAAAPRPSEGWVTVGELLARVGAPADASGAGWVPWDRAAASVPEDPHARAAYDAYGEAAQAVDRYMNSGAADLAVLDKAIEQLRAAQAARFYRPMPEAESLDATLRARLIAVYRRLKAPAPASLFSGEPQPGAAAADKPTGVRSVAGASQLSFDNPAESLAKPPAPGVDGEPWRLLGLFARWGDASVDFTLRVGRVDPHAAPRPVYEVYMDLNGVTGAGAPRPLEPRGVFFPTRDAWEYALVVAGDRARLFRHNPRGEPEPVGAFVAVPDPAKASWTVSVPRSALRGSPRRWGFTVLSYAEDPARPGLTPPAALVAPDGGIVLGLLAPLDVQKTVLDKRSPNARVPASRRD
ncbi:MAG: hypothetical protein SF051_12175 [Elusimicrobiota bacterium]|nr:hypothetical protein [Elusimicrobiota bacterium]